jgi:hypothetical protein
MPENKFRPAITEAEIRYLIARCDTESDELLRATAAGISARLKVFLVKAQVGLVAPAFSSAGRLTLEQKLGVEPADTREACYQKWIKYPELCSPKEIAAAELYAYENDLMTPDQEKEYEARTV